MPTSKRLERLAQRDIDQETFVDERLAARPGGGRPPLRPGASLRVADGRAVEPDGRLRLVWTKDNRIRDK